MVLSIRYLATYIYSKPNVLPAEHRENQMKSSTNDHQQLLPKKLFIM